MYTTNPGQYKEAMCDTCLDCKTIFPAAHKEESEPLVPSLVEHGLLTGAFEASEGCGSAKTIFLAVSGRVLWLLSLEKEPPVFLLTHAWN